MTVNGDFACGMIQVSAARYVRVNAFLKIR
jgi:hypothetical protein